jgi:hypothetical protein
VGDVRRALPDPLQHDLGEDDGGDVLSRALLDHAHLGAAPDEAGELLQGHVAAGLDVVELAVVVTPDDALGGWGSPGLHAGNITRCVMNVKVG